MLRNLAELAEQRSDVVAAAHWWQQLVEISPDEPEATNRLARLLIERGCYPRPAQSGVTTGKFRGSGRTGTTRLLLVVDFFYPSVGGTERLAEQTVPGYT